MHQASSLGLKRRAEFASVFADLVRRYAIDSEFAGMAHEPALHRGMAQFRMTLKRERTLAPGKYLIGADVGGGEQTRVRWKIEGVAMPMEHAGGLRCETADRRGRGLRHECQRLPANLFLRRGINSGAERPGHELSSETNSHHRQIAGQTRFEEADFFAKKRIDGLFIGADGCAEYDEKIRLDGVKGAEVFHSGFDVADGETCCWRRTV